MSPAGSAAEPTLADVGEFGLIDLVRTAAEAPHVLVGPGDDAALVRTSPDGMLASLDVAVEGRHFRRDWSSARDVGHKVAAANLADIAAMGGTGRSLLVGLSAPGDLPVSWAVELTDGLVTEAASVGAVVVGGDVTAANSIVVSVSVLGDPGEQVVRRNGARPGDVVAVAGRLGWAGAGLAVLTRGFRSPRAVVEAHRRPQPPYSAGPQAAAAGAHAMVDVSDGLLADLGHVARASGVRLDLRSDAVEVPEPLQAVGAALGVEPLGFVLTGGDDHALAGCFAAGSVPDGWLKIGLAHAVDETAAVTVDGAPWPDPPGHAHFG
jgi:thiamine-monophosphate kinase